jgi:hypothetical protein
LGNQSVVQFFVALGGFAEGKLILWIKVLKRSVDDNYQDATSRKGRLISSQRNLESAPLANYSVLDFDY